MAELMKLQAFDMHQALTYLGGMPAVKAYEWLSAYYSDPNQLLPKAIERATEQTWQTLAMALDDQPSLGEQLKRQFAPEVVKDMVEPLRVLVAERDVQFRRRCRDELARRGLNGAVDAKWRQAVVGCPPFITPTEALEHSLTVIADEAALLRRAGFAALPQLIELELPNGGGSLPLYLFNNFLRATVADNSELSKFFSFNLEVNIELLLRKIEAREQLLYSLNQEGGVSFYTDWKLKSEVEFLTQENTNLQSKLDTLISNIYEQVTEQKAKAKDIVGIDKNQLEAKVSRMKAAKMDLVAQKHKIELLEKEYADCFVPPVRKRVKSKSICPRCGGDGGVRGGCQKCDGNGWVDV